MKTTLENITFKNQWSHSYAQQSSDFKYRQKCFATVVISVHKATDLTAVEFFQLILCHRAPTRSEEMLCGAAGSAVPRQRWDAGGLLFCPEQRGPHAQHSWENYSSQQRLTSPIVKKTFIFTNQLSNLTRILAIPDFSPGRMQAYSIKETLFLPIFLSL